MSLLDEMCAKSEPFQSVPVHGVVSGVTAQVLFSDFLSEGTAQKLSQTLHLSPEETASLVGYLVSLHDVGKLAPRFMEKIAPPELRQRLAAEGLSPRFSQEARHEKTTRQAVYKLWQEQGINRRTAEFYAGVLGAHHQGKVGDGEDPGARWVSLQAELEGRMRAFFGPKPALPTVPRTERGFTGAVLLGLTVLADWIASSPYFQSAEAWIARDDSREHIRENIRARAAAFLQKSGLSRQPFSCGGRFCELWPEIPEDGMRPLQTETEALFGQTEERISLVLLEAPMGEGKTEAGVYAALRMARQWRKNGFYIGLPTAATSNQMVGRIRKLLAQHEAGRPVRLLHAMAWLVDEQLPEQSGFAMDDDEEENAALRWLEPVRRGLLGAYAVGTVDQAMMSVLMVKYGVLRLLGLSGKALVIDELHAYDAYMSGILTSLLTWCRALEIPVVLLSATLPPEKKQEMLSLSEPVGSAYPAVTAVTESGTLLVRPIPGTVRRQTVGVRLCRLLHRPDEIAREALAQTEGGGCLCVLLNTVRQAQAVYRALREQGSGVRLLLFHAQFPASRRDEIEKECLRLFGPDKSNRPGRAILVATQVVEQSLDIDMDGLITAVAPVDLLLQRMGRMYRHDHTPRPAAVKGPVLQVLAPEGDGFGEDEAVYPACLLRQSLALLQDRREIRVPEDMAQLVADGYDSEKAPPEEQNAWAEWMLENEVERSMTVQYLLGRPDAAFRPLLETVDFDDLERSSYLSARTRLGEPTRRIALLEPEFYETLAAQAEVVQGRRCVRVRSRELARAVLAQSVSVREKLLHGFEAGLCGKGLLEGTLLFPSEQGVYRGQDGRRIVFDPVLGVVWEGGTA